MTEESVRVTRVVEWPRARVWKVWTDPTELARWWWPARFRTKYSIDLREDGAYRIESADLPDIGVLGITGRFLSLQPPAELRYIWRWLHEESESEVHVAFADRGRQTEILVIHTGLATADERQSHITGWSDCLNRLGALAAESVER